MQFINLGLFFVRKNNSGEVGKKFLTPGNSPPFTYTKKDNFVFF